MEQPAMPVRRSIQWKQFERPAHMSVPAGRPVTCGCSSICQVNPQPFGVPGKNSASRLTSGLVVGNRRTCS